MDQKELQKQTENDKTAISINLSQQPIITLNVHVIQESIERIIHHDIAAAAAARVRTAPGAQV